MTSYQYSITSDITNQDVNLAQLQSEIEVSLSTTGITRDDDIINVYFSSVLSSGDKTTLDGIVQDHVAVVPEVFRNLYRPKDTYLISPSGGDFETIKEGLDTVGPGSLLLIYPGTYLENNPLTLRHDTVLRGEGYPITINIVGVNPTQPVFIMEQQTILEGVHITGAYGTGGVGVFVDSSIGFGRAMMTRTIVSNCETGYKATFVNTLSPYPPCTMMCLETMVVATPTTTLAIGYHSDAGSMLRCIDTGVTGNLFQQVGVGYYCTGVHPFTGDASILRINSGGIQYAGVALCCDGGGELESHSNRIEHSTTGCEIGVNGTTSKMGVHGIVFNDISGNHIQTLNTECIIYATGGRLRNDKVNIPHPNNITYDVFYFSDEPSNTALQVNGVLSVGDKLDGTKAYFGNGYSHINNVTTMTNTNGEVGTWNDLSSDLLVDNTVLTPLFAGTGIEQSFYVGDTTRFSSIYLQFTTALGGGEITIEYWNGTTWDTLHVMCKEYNPPYNSFQNNCFGNVTKVVIYLGRTENWATRSLNSLSKYWVRFRITSAITTAPVSCHLRLYNSVTAFEQDGYTLHMGDARTCNIIPLSINDFCVTDGTPTDQDIYLDNSVKVSAKNNRFPPTGTTGIGRIFHLPLDMDTSCPIELCLNWFPTDNSSGGVRFRVTYGKTSTQVYLTSGDAPASTATHVTLTSTVTATSKGTLAMNDFDLYFSDATQNDSIFISVQRLGDDGSDTYGGDIVVSCIDMKYWCNCRGGHFSLAH